MSDDLKLRDPEKAECLDPNDGLPNPTRQLAKLDRVWGIAVDKKPKLPLSYKNHKDLMTYNNALGCRDKFISDGIKNVVLYLVLRNTKVVFLDFDPDKTTGKLRPSQIELLKYYKEDYKAPILISSSGRGYHVPLLDPDNKLPKTGPNLVKSGAMPCEILREMVFFTGNIHQSLPIPDVDDRIVALANKAKPKNKHLPGVVAAPKKQPRPPRPPRTPRPPDKEAVYIKKQSVMIIDKYKVAKIPIAIDSDSFFETACDLKSCGWDNQEIDNFMQEQPGYDNEAYKRICSANPKGVQLNNLIKKAKTAGVLPEDYPFYWPYKYDDDDSPDDRIKVLSSLGKTQGFEFCLKELGIKIRENELVGQEVLIPGCKDWQEIDQVMFSKLYVDYVTKHCVSYVKKKWVSFEVAPQIRREVIDTLATRQPSVNPTRDWLKTIEPVENIKAIDTLISCYKIDPYERLANANKTPEEIQEYYRAGFILGIAGPVMRSLSPGCVYEMMVLLIGPQGCGKGLGIKLFLPPIGIDPITGKVLPNLAFADHCKVSTNRDDWYHNRRCSVGEVTEMIGFNKLELERIKAVISATHDYIEHKFRDGKRVYPKTYALIGTTNVLNPIPADAEGNRRIFPLDLGYGFEGGRRDVSKKITEVLTPEWRTKAFGHVLWLIKNKGYTADSKDWSPNVESCREIMVGQSSKQYHEIEAALIEVATGKIDSDNKGWYIFKPTYSSFVTAEDNDAFLKHGLPFNPQGFFPSNLMTWIRLLTIHNSRVVDKYGADKILHVAIQQLGGEVSKEAKSFVGYKKYRRRGWLKLPCIKDFERFKDKDEKKSTTPKASHAPETSEIPNDPDDPESDRDLEEHEGQITRSREELSNLVGRQHRQRLEDNY